jgi:hypothetical protein
VAVAGNDPRIELDRHWGRLLNEAGRILQARAILAGLPIDDPAWDKFIEDGREIYSRLITSAVKV